MTSLTHINLTDSSGNDIYDADISVDQKAYKRMELGTTVSSIQLHTDSYEGTIERGNRIHRVNVKCADVNQETLNDRSSSESLSITFSGANLTTDTSLVFKKTLDWRLPYDEINPFIQIKLEKLGG